MAAEMASYLIVTKTAADLGSKYGSKYNSTNKTPSPTTAEDLLNKGDKLSNSKNETNSGIGKPSTGAENAATYPHLTEEQQQIIKNAENISTAKPGKQATVPRDLNEQLFWNEVKINPSAVKKFSDHGKDLNTDLRFPKSAGFEKMYSIHKLSNGDIIEIHYQYNSYTGKAYDMKIVTPKRH